MSSEASERAKSKSSEELINKGSTIRAILIPRSASATYTTQLHENRAVAQQAAKHDRLGMTASLKQSVSSSDPVKLESKTVVGRKSIDSLNIVLSQSRDQCTFTFGSSPSNDVVFKHPDDAYEEASDLNREPCYIHLLHLELCPDPDDDTFKLYNKSTSAFAVHLVSSASQYQSDDNLFPGKSFRLHCGRWRLRLGCGFDFELEILPRPCRDTSYGSLPSPKALMAVPAKSESKIKSTHDSDTKARTLQSQKGPAKSKSKSMSKSDMTKTQKEVSDHQHAEIRASKNPVSSQQVHVTRSVPRQNIGRTKRTYVFKAIRNGMVVAVKKCRKPELRSSAATWSNELQILRELHHPSIIKLIYHDAADLTLEIEYIGPDLSHFADSQQQSRLSTEQRYQIWTDVSKGLHYIHSMNVVHFDIKPENILLGAHRAVLCDFGISAKVPAGPILCHNGGTPCYIPPEFLIDVQRGFPGDVWALGVTLLFVFGVIPLPRGTWLIADVPKKSDAQIRMLAWLRSIEESLGNVSGTYELLHAMLDKNPRKRITAAQLVDKLPAMLVTEHAEIEGLLKAV